MDYCPSCGERAVEGARFCYACGGRLAPPDPHAYSQASNEERSLLDLPLPPHTPVPVEGKGSITAPDEILTYETSSPVLVDNKKWKAYVTTKHVLLRRSEGLIFPRESHQEIDPTKVHRIALIEAGALLKEYSLRINDIELKGRKSDLVNLYRAIQALRAQKSARAIDV